MQQKIGNVILDKTFYKGEDLYSDGEIEDVILQAYENGRAEELLHSSSAWPVLYHISDIRENILEWYPVDKNADVLEIGSGCGAVTGILSRKARSVTCIDLSVKRSLINAYRNADKDHIRIFIGNFQDIRLEQKFDYITLIGVWEYSGLYVQDEMPYHKMLSIVREYLKPDGKIIVAVENKTGLKYWNGAAEDHTGRMYSGLNDYIDDGHIRTFSKAEIEEILSEVGLGEYQFYYPMPDYKLPDTIYTDDMLPMPGDIRVYRKDYVLPRIYNFYDAAVSDQVCRDRMFSYFANSYLFVCSRGKAIDKSIYQTADDKQESNGCRTVFVKYSTERKKQFQTATVIQRMNHTVRVVKKALNHESESHIKKLKQNEQLWKGMLPGLKYVDGEERNGVYTVPFIEGRNIDHMAYSYRHCPGKMAEYIRNIINSYLKPDENSMTAFVECARFRTIFGSTGDSLKDSRCLRVSNIDLLFSNLRLRKYEQNNEDRNNVELDEDRNNVELNEERNNGERNNIELYNFDYEWVFDFPIPYEYALWRAVDQLYDQYAVYLKNKISRRDFYDQCGLDSGRAGIYKRMERNFSNYVYGNKYIEQYKKHVITQTVNIM